MCDIFIGSKEPRAIMYHQSAKGSYYEIGKQIGTEFKEIYTNFNWFPPKFTEEQIKLSKAFETEARKFTPDLLDEIRGIADGSGFEYETLMINELTPYRNETNCLVMVISGEHTKSGLPIIAKNHEWIEDDSDALTICRTEPNKRIASYGFTFIASSTSRYGGINKSGLAISSVSANFAYSGPGVMLNIATRWILDNCETTEEGVEFLERMPKVWGNVYLLIDKHNTIAKVEAHREKTVVTYTNRGFDMATLRFESEEMHPFNYKDDLASLYFPRKEFISRWFEENKGNINGDLINEVLKNHENSICNHSKSGNQNYGICWSWIISIGDPVTLISEGAPCKNELQNIEIRF